LVILAAKHRHTRSGGRKKFRHDGGDAFEMPRAKSSTKRLGDRANPYSRLLPRRIHGGHGWVKYAGSAVGNASLHIAFPRAGVLVQVFGRTKLCRVDENTDNHEIGMTTGLVDEREMAVMQSPHRGNQPDALFLRARSITSLSIRG